MKIVVINGSARKGNTQTAIEAFAKGSSGKHEVEVIAADKLQIAPCKGCDACECHYGIITTNGKSLDFQGVSAFVAVYSIPFPKLKYGEKIDEKRRLLH